MVIPLVSGELYASDRAVGPALSVKHLRCPVKWDFFLRI